ncbi:hypothetical protein ACWGQ2_08660 [Arthrobacter sp. NPDC055585]
MEFVVIVLFVAAIVLVNFLVGRAQRKRAGRPAAEKPKQQPSAGNSAKPLRTPAGTSLEAAREAVAQLDEKGHQQVYAAIAQGQPIRAIQIYAQNTGCGLRAASAAVASMASHPVPFTRPQPRPEQQEQPPAAAAPAADSAPAEAAEPAKEAAPEDQAGQETAARDAATRDAAPRSAGATPAAAGTGAAGKDKPQDKAKDKEPAAPDDAEISRWAQNLRPEDF